MSRCGVPTASSRKSYDTDSITLRNIYAYDISNNSPFSTGYILTSLTKGFATFMSPLVSLSTVGFSNLPAELSTVAGDLLSTIYWVDSNFLSTPAYLLPSTVTGLSASGYISTSQLTSTVVGLGSAGYLSAAVLTFPIASTVIGLGTAGYVSTLSLYSSIEGLGSVGYLSTPSLVSTVEGLGSSGYVSTFDLTSTVTGLGTLGYLSSFDIFISSISSLAEIGYVSTSQLTSTVAGLGTAGYVSSTQLASTVAGLGSIGYLSTTTPIYRSTYSNLGVFAPNYCNIAYLYSNLLVNQSVNTISFNLGESLRSKIEVSTSKLDIELKTNLQFVYYDATSRDYQFNNFLIQSSNFRTSNVIGQESLTYYILNANPINLPYFFLPTSRFLIKDVNTLSTLRDDTRFSTMCLVHTFSPRIPATNQFFASPMSTACVNITLDNTPSP